MSLNDFDFILFFATLLALLMVVGLFKSAIKKKADFILRRLQIIILLVFSYFFVCCTDIRFGVCIFALTLFSYFFGLITDFSTGRKKQIYLVVGIIVCLAMLCYFKYSSFFVESFAVLFGTSSTTLNIILPIGISFYTFTAISYLIDVYRRKYPAERNIINFALFIAFFPKLTAGPIVRGDAFFPQIGNYVGITKENFTEGIQIFVFGLFKKIVLADRLGVFVDDVFFAPSAYHTASVVLAIFSYSIQIYMDFSGYSDMAIGISKILGFDFPKNFNLPYTAENISDFWKRWHISLSSWFKDYLYIPLGGNRKGYKRTLCNIMIVMLCSGLWHGAGWTFIIWGFFYGVANCIFSVWRAKRKEKSKRSSLHILSTCLTFVTVTLFWVPFRSESIEKMLQFYKTLFTYHDGILQPYTWSFFAFLCVGACMAAAAIRSKRAKDKQVNSFYPLFDLSKTTSLIIFFTFCGLTVLLAYFGNNAFIYGKF